jgi:hypothetical protein
MEKQVHTFESVWAAMQESNRFLTEKQAEAALQRKENERFLTQKLAGLTEKQEEAALQMKENERFLTEKLAGLTEKQAETDRIVKELAKELGGMSKNNGLIAEEYFFNSFERGQTNFFGEKFDEIEKNLKNRRQGITDEYDIVLYNHTSVALIEVKYKAHKGDLPKVLKKADNFRILFPDYKDFKIYLGLASLSFYGELEESCREHGIAIIKQTGENIVIYDEHLKVF